MYQLNGEEQMILDLVDKLCTDVLSVRGPEIDKEDTYPWDIQKLFAENGLIGMMFPPEYGGSGVSMNCWLRCIERISRDSITCASILTTATVGTAPLRIGGTAEQKARYFPGIASGETLACFALTEPEAGTHVANIQTTAVPQGDHYVISGSKVFATGGSVADLYTIFAQVNVEGKNKLTCFLIDRNSEGITVGRDEDKMGMRGSCTTQLFFDKVVVPAENMVGSIGEGYRLAYETLNASRLCAAAFGNALTYQAWLESLNYANTRKQFDTSIGTFQAIREKLANMEIDYKTGEVLMDHAATLYQDNNPELRTYSSVAKVFCSEMAIRATSDALQIFGGYGFCKDYPVERLYREAHILTIIEGTNEVQRDTLARAALKAQAEGETL